MAHLRNTISIDATPEAVWAVLGDLAATREWLPGTLEARLEGSTRICTMADGAEVREEISEYSSDSRSFAFRHLAVPLPVRESHGTFAVQPTGDGASLVVLESEVEALDPAASTELERMFDGALKQALESLRRRVEQGIRWDAA